LQLESRKQDCFTEKEETKRKIFFFFFFFFFYIYSQAFDLFDEKVFFFVELFIVFGAISVKSNQKLGHFFLEKESAKRKKKKTNSHFVLLQNLQNRFRFVRIRHKHFLIETKNQTVKEKKKNEISLLTKT
jgi:hypothetical protein